MFCLARAMSPSRSLLGTSVDPTAWEMVGSARRGDGDSST